MCIRDRARSMSRKGTSPDNAACEGFFGNLKNEFFHGRDSVSYTHLGESRPTSAIHSSTGASEKSFSK